VTDSSSFPGLPTRYELHQLEAIVHGLPHAGFETEAQHGGKYFHWEWCSDSALVPRRAATSAGVSGRPCEAAPSAVSVSPTATGALYES
jgi:hypothetical protein